MHHRVSILLSTALAIAFFAPRPAVAQKTETVIRSESRLVLVDSVVTDKKGYVTDLARQDFHVYQDGKEFPIQSFSFETTPQGGARAQYFALFFANPRTTPVDDARIRDAAVSLIKTNAAPNRYFAVINFGTILRVTQNFTSDIDLAIAGVLGKNLGQSGLIASMNGPDLSEVEGDFAAGSVLQGLRSLAKGMSRIPGRKTVIFLTSGFPVSGDKFFELQAAIDACNKANVAVYPLDVRGLTVGGKAADSSSDLRVPEAPPRWSDGVFHPAQTITVRPAAWSGAPQSRPSGGGNAGGARVGMLGTYIPDATGDSRAPSTLRRPLPPVADMNNNMTNPQDVLYVLAAGTGGFVIVNTNDLLSGMQKITQEQNAYYMIGFVPPPAPEGSCHRLKVKVDRGGTLVRSRNTYCTVKPVDLLSGDPVAKKLEDQLDAPSAAPAAVQMSAPFFFTARNTARVNLVLEIPASALNLQNSGGKFRGEFNVLGIAYQNDGRVAARFSDAVKLELDKKQFEALRSKPYRYEKQFLIGSGDYKLKVVMASGETVLARAETPLKVDPYDNTKLNLSTVTITSDVVDLSKDPGIAEQAMLQDRTLLIFEGMEFVPPAAYRFHRADQTLIYAEIYEPALLSSANAGINIQYQVTDRKTGATLLDTGMFAPNIRVRPGFPVVPLVLKLVVDRLTPGSYRLNMQAMDGAGQRSPVRTADFEVE